MIAHDVTISLIKILPGFAPPSSISLSLSHFHTTQHTMTTDSLPFIQDAESPLSDGELEVLKKQYAREGEYVTVQTKFNYAWGLVKSRRSAETTDGVRLLTEIYTESPERRRECLYYLAVGNYKLANYTDARKYNEQLLALEPKNSQALALRRLIEDKVSREGVIGMAIVTGIAAIGGVIIAGLMRTRRDR
ncbi:putative mitochondrial membrane fission protein [Jimgerdemannia flammicorona]|uniref:Mitochondrial fission 1 protein n=1 Tax=Jimgerdemannia flammicorona TaxID=994334 RepID=A0A433PBM8_9FUNG|nr:putative mitochondrial membrane fission protein [Jimgerdemannia flammicorona]